VILIILFYFINYTNWIDELDAKVDADVDSMYVKRIDIDDLMGYVYIVRVNYHWIQVWGVPFSSWLLKYK
jgi:hypothetical protein